jgi:acyl CoA:acetate/3-ketoacid CoA transferase alpha subunit
MTTSCSRSTAVCIAEVEEIVPAGTLRPEDVHLPGIYVSRLIQVRFHSARP